MIDSFKQFVATSDVPFFIVFGTTFVGTFASCCILFYIGMYIYSALFEK